MNAKTLHMVGVTLMLIGSCGISHGQSNRASNCDGDGPFALRINLDLLREDLRVEEVEELPLSPTIERNHGQERQAHRGVCQDPRTGRTIFEHEFRLQTLDRLPLEDGSTGGDEGDELSENCHAF